MIGLRASRARPLLTGLAAALALCAWSPAHGAGETVKRLLQPRDRTPERLLGNEQSKFAAGHTFRLQIVNEGLQLNVQKWARNEGGDIWHLWREKRVTGVSGNPIQTWQAFPILLLGSERDRDGLNPAIEDGAARGFQIVVTQAGVARPRQGSEAFTLDPNLSDKLHVTPPARPSVGERQIQAPNPADPVELTVRILPPDGQLSADNHDRRFSLWAAMPIRYVALAPKYCRIAGASGCAALSDSSREPGASADGTFFRELPLDHYEPYTVPFAEIGCDQVGDEGYCSQGGLRISLLGVDSGERLAYVTQRLRAAKLSPAYVKDVLVDYWLLHKVVGCPGDCVVVEDVENRRKIADAILDQHETFGASGTDAESNDLLSFAGGLDPSSVRVAVALVDVQVRTGALREAVAKAKEIYKAALDRFELAVSSDKDVTRAVVDLSLAARALANVWPRPRVGTVGIDIAYANAVLQRTISDYLKHYAPHRAEAEGLSVDAPRQYASMIADQGHLFLRTRGDRDLDRAVSQFARALVETPRSMPGRAVAVGADGMTVLTLEPETFGAESRFLRADQVQLLMSTHDDILGSDGGSRWLVSRPGTGATAGQLFEASPGPEGATACSVPIAPRWAIPAGAKAGLWWVASAAPPASGEQALSLVAVSERSDTGECAVKDTGLRLAAGAGAGALLALPASGNSQRLLIGNAGGLSVVEVNLDTGIATSIGSRPAELELGSATGDAVGACTRPARKRALGLALGCEVELAWEKPGETALAALRVVTKLGAHAIEVRRVSLLPHASGKAVELAVAKSWRVEADHEARLLGAATFAPTVEAESALIFLAARPEQGAGAATLRRTTINLKVVAPERAFRPGSAGALMSAPWAPCAGKAAGELDPDLVDASMRCFAKEGLLALPSLAEDGAAEPIRLTARSTPFAGTMVGTVTIAAEWRGARSCPVSISAVNIEGLTGTSSAVRNSAIRSPTLLDDPRAALERQTPPQPLAVRTASCGAARAIAPRAGGATGPRASVLVPVRALQVNLASFNEHGRALQRWPEALEPGASVAPLAGGSGLVIRYVDPGDQGAPAAPPAVAGREDRRKVVEYVVTEPRPLLKAPPDAAVERYDPAGKLGGLDFATFDVPPLNPPGANGGRVNVPGWLRLTDLPDGRRKLRLTRPGGSVVEEELAAGHDIVVSGVRPGSHGARRVFAVGPIPPPSSTGTPVVPGPASAPPAGTPDASLALASLYEVSQPRDAQPAVLVARHDVEVAAVPGKAIVAILRRPGAGEGISAQLWVTVDREDNGLRLHRLAPPSGPPSAPGPPPPVPALASSPVSPGPSPAAEPSRALTERMTVLLPDLLKDDIVAVYSADDGHVVAEAYEAREGRPARLKNSYAFDLKDFVAGKTLTATLHLRARDAGTGAFSSLVAVAGVTNFPRTVLIQPDDRLFASSAKFPNAAGSCVAFRAAPGHGGSDSYSYPSPAVADERPVLISASTVVTTGAKGSAVWPRIAWTTSPAGRMAFDPGAVDCTRSER